MEIMDEFQFPVCRNCKGTGKVTRPSIRFMDGDRSATKEIDCPSRSMIRDAISVHQDIQLMDFEIEVKYVETF